MQVSTNMELKKKNRNDIFRLILERGKISKQEIANTLHLSLPTVHQNLCELSGMGLVTEEGTFASTGGRKAKCLTCISRARVAFGIDITANHTTVVMVDLNGEILDHIRIRTQNYPWEAYLPLIRNSLKEMLERNQIPVEKVLGAGVTLPAIIGEDHRTIQYLTLLDLPADFYDALGEAIPFPYRFCNDANGAGFAELWKRKTSATMLYLFLSATVGGAILQNGRIYMGAHQRGGEFGHMTLIPDGKKCYCGKRGCVDCYLASGVLSEYTEGRMEDFFRLLDEGDRECVRRWQEYSRYLAIVINNLQCAYDCKIVIGGHIGGFIEKYLKDIRAMVASRNTHSAECDYVEASMMKWEASAMGGALLYIDEFIKNI